MGIEETVERLRADVTAAQRRHASASALAQQADARAEAVRTDLESEFGVTTVPAGRDLLAGLEQQLGTEVAEVQRLLDLAGGAA